jgi:hypothetical protein
MSNDMSSIQILLRNMERQQINTAIDEQYAKLSKEMAFEAKNSVKNSVKTKTNGSNNLDHRKNDDDNKHKSKPIVSKKNDPLLQKLVDEGLATVGKTKPITKKKPFKVSGELDYKAYNLLSIDNQLKYDREMATAYTEAGRKKYYQRPTQTKILPIYKPPKNGLTKTGLTKVFFGNPNKKPILMDYGTI